MSMKRQSPIDESSRFRGGLKHYHRAGSDPRSSWEQWVDGENAGRPPRRWGRIVGLVVLALALIGIGVALYIEMG